MEHGLSAGTAVTEISPPIGVELAGYPHFPRYNTGVHDPLYASCLYLQHGDDRLALVAMDLLFLSKRLVLDAKQAISARTGISEDHLLFFCSHTHSGPWTSGRLDLEALEKDLKPDPDYIRLLLARLEDLVAQASAHPFEAWLGYGSGTCGRERGVGGNRRDPDGPCDPQVQAVGVRDATGAWRACFTGYALHPTLLHGESTLVSADYPAFVRKYLSWSKPGMVLLFAQGTSGNQSSRYFRDGQNFEEACRIGTTIGLEVDRVLDGMTPLAVQGLSVRRGAVDADLRALPSVGDAEAAVSDARARLEDLTRQGASYLDRRNAELKLLGAEDLLGYAIFARRGKGLPILVDEMPLDVTVARIGDLRIVGMQGEIFTEFGLEIKRRSPVAPTMVLELCNGAAPGYVYTREALAEGGYETDTSLLGPDCGDRFVEKALELLREGPEASESSRASH
jgi:neutral ceramidase